jgi:hypothetical protein
LDAVPGVPPGNVASGGGDAVAVSPGVALGSRVALGLGTCVSEGVKARSRVTCAHTVEATCVLCAFRSTVGALVGVSALLQAAKRRKTSPIAMTANVFIVCDI